VIAFTVYGIPRPGGSKRAFFRAGMKRPVVTEDCRRSKDWRSDVKAAALAGYKGPPLVGPLVLDVIFLMPRPKGHYGTGKRAGLLKASAPYHCETKPDATKLLRSTEDALTGILWRDDSQIVLQQVEKRYGERPGAFITVKRADSPQSIE